MFTYQTNGHLSPGIYDVDWDAFTKEFGFNDHRKLLIEGLALGIEHFGLCGCKAIYVDGSFVSRKAKPADYDACWDTNGVNMPYLKMKYPTLVDFGKSRLSQKLKYKGEFFPATQIANPPKEIYIDFFQKDRDGDPKGIIKLSI